jgi:hypothetical protein
MAASQKAPAARRPGAEEPQTPNDRAARVAFNVLMGLLVLSLVAMIWIALIG